MTRGTGGITAVSDLSMYKIFALGPLLRRDVLVGAVAVAGGYLGSLLHQTMISNSATIRAERFEVVERSGRLLSYWGLDPDSNIRATSSRGTLLVFLDSQKVRRLQLGSDSGSSPHLLFYDQHGPPDTPERYDAQPRFGIRLGETGSPVLSMRGSYGDKVILGANYGDVVGERELGWGLFFAALEVPATAAIGYSRSWDGSYRSGVAVTNGAGERWAADVGNRRKPLLLPKQPRR